MRPTGSTRAFTLVEVIVALTISSIVLAAIFSTYLFLGRNLTRLSYQRILEQQSRTILTTLANDVRNAKGVTSATNTDLSLTVYNQDPSKGSVPTMSVSYSYSYDSVNNVYILTRNSIPLVKMITSDSLSVPVTLLLPPTGAPSAGNLFQYYTTNASLLSSPVTSVMSIKQVEMSFILQAGALGIQDQQGTLTLYQMSSGRISFNNRQLPDGN